MWNKAEENTEALRSAFEAAAERAAEEAELATAEALARADREYRGTTLASLAFVAFLVLSVFCDVLTFLFSLAFLGLCESGRDGLLLHAVCVFTFNRYFHPSTSSTPSCPCYFFIVEGYQLCG